MKDISPLEAGLNGPAASSRHAFFVIMQSGVNQKSGHTM
jgi:hypothetical protein